MNRLDGEIAFISGAAPGIGAATARLMAQAAKVAIFVASDDAGFMTGSSLVVDGGLTAQ